MVRTLTILVAALAAVCVSAIPLNARKATAAATKAATPTAVAAAGLATINASAAAAFASAFAAEQAAIDADPSVGHIDPEISGQQAFLETKTKLLQDAGDDAGAAKIQKQLDDLNASLGGAAGR
ncbi:hypothetical protein DFH08DRAFT_1088200 [Mycena albidolilacea]|uniref:Uncharacterized protein n=1 Tax=Mycena albidolilacea TaxID=1033008 RepID=A0AAD7ECA4_9AGAR|nr:hypothetical protein DFH08DRAFT_1088200 [Mycena albidolilacea]